MDCRYTTEKRGRWDLWTILLPLARLVRPLPSKLDISTDADRCLCAGILTAVLTNPIWVIKTRMLSTGASAPGAYSSVSSGAMQIFRTDGIPGFYRGLVPSLFGVSHGAFQFMAYEQLKRWRANASLLPTGTMSDSSESLTNADFILLPALSKIFAGSITYPYQVVRSRLQTYDADQAYKGTMDAVGQVWTKEGLRGFYKGLGPNLLRVLPSTCVTFLVYENMRRWLGDGGSGWKPMLNGKG
jgi:solute carrier family 25 (mitochondrial folate transporter), member 32